MYAYAGQPQQAVEAYRRALALGEDAITLGNLALSYADLGRHSESIAAAERGLALAEDLEFARAALAYVYGRAGRRADAERYIGEIEAQPVQNAYLLATAYAGVGNRARVLAALEKAAEDREPGILDVAVDPVFAEYWSHPRVQAVIRRLGLGR
jgi:tetratricopeptide (TPR) repeat protein